MAKRAGYTLLELMTVIVIAGIMIGVALPLMNALLRGNKLENAAQHISNTLSLARQMAIAKRQKIYVCFDPVTKEYWISEKYPHQPDDPVVGKKHKLPDTVDYDSSPNEPPKKENGPNDYYGFYRFKPTGQASHSEGFGSFNFRIIDTTTTPNKYREISVVNTTGRIKVRTQ